MNGVYSFLIMIVIFALNQSAFSQLVVDGQVLDEEGIPLPGVNVFEKGTDNGAVSDIDGEFSLTTTDSVAALFFEFVGCQPYEVIVGKSQFLHVVLKVDSTITEFIPYCFFYTSSYSVGMDYGFIHQNLGIISYNFISNIKSLNILMNANLVWRFPHQGNEYFDVFLRKHEIISGMPFNFYLATGYNKTTEDNILYLNQQFFISPEVSKWGFLVGIGYARVCSSVGDSLLNENGVYASFVKSFFYQLTLKARVVATNNYLNYNFRLIEDLPNFPASVELGYEKQTHWKELKLAIMYQF